MLLPRMGSVGKPLDDSVFAQTRAELVQAFEGVTAYLRSPAQGAWVAPDGRVERDDVVMVEVLTDRFDRAWWHAHAGTLARRFRQEAIHIRALPALTPEAPNRVRVTRSADVQPSRNSTAGGYARMRHAGSDETPSL